MRTQNVEKIFEIINRIRTTTDFFQQMKRTKILTFWFTSIIKTTA